MNENEGQKKDFISIENDFIRLGEQRDKLICELDEIIDGIKQNRKPQVEVKRDSSLPTPPSDDVISRLRDRISEMDRSNEKLKLISNRLNELV